ncbi:MAG: DUF58 domain-containing protein [Planctomycetaceae bacterium]
MPLFNSDFLTRLEYLSLVSKKVFRGQMMAQRRTTAVGSGVEFADHRQYYPGDDFRYLDWNLFARHDELLLKRFQEEEDLHVYLLLDCSRSMAAGDTSKFDLARQVAAALAYIALADLDRVSVFAFADGLIDEFPLTRGKARILSLMQFLEKLQPAGASTSLSELAAQFVHRSHRRGLAVVLSDLFDPDGFQRGIDLLRYHRYEPHIVQLSSRRDTNPLLLGDVELCDAETGEVRNLVITEKHQQAYQARFAAFLASLREYCSKYGIGCTIADAEMPFDELVLGMIRSTGSG